MNNVVEFNGATTLDIPAEKVLRAALACEMREAIVIGRDGNGEWYYASSVTDAGKMLFHLEAAKMRVMSEACE